MNEVISIRLKKSLDQKKNFDVYIYIKVISFLYFIIPLWQQKKQQQQLKLQTL
jgi:hypothetical protein